MDFGQQECFAGDVRSDWFRSGPFGIGAGEFALRKRAKNKALERQVKEQAWPRASRNWKI
jgi:hypothetical protein